MYPPSYPEFLYNAQALDLELDLAVAELNELHFVIHHSHCSKILLRTNPSHGQLPFIRTRSHPLLFFYERTDEFLPKVQHYLNLTFQVTLLRCIWYKNYASRGSYNHCFRAIFVLESHGEQFSVPTGLQWMNLTELIFPKEALIHGRSEITRFFEEVTSGTIPSQRASFTIRGWFSKTKEWIRNQLSQNGFQEILDVTQVRCAWRGCVLKVKLGDGVSVYLKCSPPFTNEAAVCIALAKIIPDNVEAPIAADIPKRLLLMRDYGEILSPIVMSDLAESRQWGKELFELQSSTINNVRVLLETGLLKIELNSLPARMDEVLQDVKGGREVDQEVVDEAWNLRGALESDCQKLAAIGLPDTFVHGDLVASNIYRVNNSAMRHGIIDFADSIVSYPLIDGILANSPEYFGRWIGFLESQTPALGKQLSLDSVMPMKECCWRVQIAIQLVKLHNDLKKMEQPPCPEVRLTFINLLLALCRKYKRAREPQE